MCFILKRSESFLFFPSRGERFGDKYLNVQRSEIFDRSTSSFVLLKRSESFLFFPRRCESSGDKYLNVHRSTSFFFILKRSESMGFHRDEIFPNRRTSILQILKRSESFLFFPSRERSGDKCLNVLSKDETLLGSSKGQTSWNKVPLSSRGQGRQVGRGHIALELCETGHLFHQKQKLRGLDPRRGERSGDKYLSFHRNEIFDRSASILQILKRSESFLFFPSTGERSGDKYLSCPVLYRIVRN
jgi:hypothetical protein